MNCWRHVMVVVVSGALGATALGQANPRVIAGPGVPVMVQGVEVTVSVKGGAESVITSASFIVRTDTTGSADPAWYWLTGSAKALKWEAVEKPAEMPGGSVAT